MSDTENMKGRMRAAFATTPLGDDRWQAVLDVLHANGYRRCAEGQRTTQWCGEVEKLREHVRERELLHAQSLDAAVAEVERLRAANAQLVAELESIAIANPLRWEFDMRDQFQAWAQSRARAAIDAARGES